MPIAPANLDPNAVALFLDVDGTLLEIQDRPSDVRADAALIETLEACFARLNGALALISGRTVAEIDRIFAPAEFPVAGAHGAERRVHRGRMVVVADAPLPDNVMQQLEAFAAGNDGLLLEHKSGGASLHYRRAPQLEAECRRFIMQTTAELGKGFRLIAGKMVFEIAQATHDKGAAILHFLDEAPFAGRLPVFVGDDVTDEDGFRAVNEMAGISIRVGGNEDSAARYCLQDVAAVLPWLGNAVLGDYPEQRHGGQ